MDKTILYDGDVELIFNEGKHTYTYNNEIIQGVTGVCSVINKPALVPWVAKVSHDFLINNYKPGKIYDETEIAELADDMKKAHRRQTTKAANIGTIAHNYIEGAIKYKLGINDNPPEKPINEQALNAINAYADFAKEYDIEYHASEPKVYSKLHRYAGTLDIDATINGKRCIVDLKTSNGIYPEMWLQTAAYQQARQEELGVKYDERWILRIGKDGTFETRVSTQFNEDIKAFVAALTLRKRLGELK